MQRYYVLGVDGHGKEIRKEKKRGRNLKGYVEDTPGRFVKEKEKIIEEKIVDFNANANEEEEEGDDNEEDCCNGMNCDEFEANINYVSREEKDGIITYINPVFIASPKIKGLSIHHMPARLDIDKIHKVVKVWEKNRKGVPDQNIKVSFSE